jgi:hypothetical protein
MPNPTEIPVVYYEQERIPDDRPGRPATAKQFYSVREAMVKACRQHGCVGPDDSRGDHGYVYYVVDDQYNDERFQYLEICKASGRTRSWLLDLAATLKKYPHWGVGIGNIGEGYLLIFPDRLMVTGPTFKGANTVAEVIRRGREALVLGEMIENATDDATLQRLSRWPGVESKLLGLNNLKAVTDAGLAFLPRLPGLQSLVLDNSAISDAGLGSFAF